jgi:hypothetical protein
MVKAQAHLVFHASLILLWGLLLGAPYARAIKRDAPAHTVHSWRVAHLSLPIGAVLMLSVAALMPMLAVGDVWLWALAIPLIASAYGFAVSTPLAAISGQRGLGSDEQGWGRWVYAANMLGVVGSLGAGLVLVCLSALAL